MVELWVFLVLWPGLPCLGSSMRRGRFVAERVQLFNVSVFFVLSFGAHLSCSNSTCPKSWPTIELFQRSHNGKHLSRSIPHEIYTHTHAQIHWLHSVSAHSVRLHLWSDLVPHIHLCAATFLASRSMLADQTRIASIEQK